MERDQIDFFISQEARRVNPRVQLETFDEDSLVKFGVKYQVWKMRGLGCFCGSNMSHYVITWLPPYQTLLTSELLNLVGLDQCTSHQEDSKQFLFLIEFNIEPRE